jgi:molybdate transport system ATP-binding protein
VLRFDVARRLSDAFELSAALDLAAGDTLVLLGESGSGKTTLLRMLAGLVAADRGRIELDGGVWLDTGRGIALDAASRPVGYVFQDYALFPHLTVAENVGFGLRAAGLGRAEARRRTDAALERFRLGPLADRRPGALSGGQQQRVAVARALVLEPALLLLDEPLSALDLATRRQVRAELRETLRAHPGVGIYVTHHPMEALVFGERIAVMADGRIAQVGTADEILRRPRSAYVAEFVGLNLLAGRVVRREPGGLARFATADGEIVVADPVAADDAFIAVSPHAIVVSREPPAGSAQNVFAGRVRELVPEPPLGERVRVALDTHPPLVAEVTRGAAASLGLAPGVGVYAAFKATGVTPYR